MEEKWQIKNLNYGKVLKWYLYKKKKFVKILVIKTAQKSEK